VAGATFSRFIYSAPILLVLAPVWFGYFGYPIVTGSFLISSSIGGIAQILATLCVLALFKQRNFAVGIAFKKTETLQIVIISLVILGEVVSINALYAIGIGFFGLVLLSKQPLKRSFLEGGIFNRSVFLGLFSGFLFAISGVYYRAATLSVLDESPINRAILTLTCVLVFQVIVMGGWLLIFNRTELKAVWKVRSIAIWVGLTSLAGSFCWFWAFSLVNAALVKAVGQVELLFSILASIVFFKEKITFRELVGIFIIALSVVGVITLA
jgi:drug/metabolite transporter (DMT)-like permease